ncbi:MAG: hypothetical protein VX100_07345 [Pseudomonadota bacterium]|nr:hypothetical protein [Pseudomonadota bacterium]
MSIFNPAERTDEQRFYCESVDHFATHRENQYISNGKAEHAIYLISKLFGMADNQLRIYSDRLKHTLTKEDRDDSGEPLDFYGHPELIKKAKRFLTKPGFKFTVVVENGLDDPQAHPLIKLVKSLEKQGTLKADCEFRQLTEEAKAELVTEEFGNHFIVADEQAYRCELNDDQHNYSAGANFGAPKTAALLAEIYDSFHIENSTPISI